MHRIDTNNAENNRFVDGNPNAGKKGTIVDASWLNSVQEELCNVVTGTGAYLDSTKDNQVLSAIKKLVSTCVKPFGFSQALTATTQWVQVGDSVNLKKGAIVDVTIGVLVSNTSGGTDNMVVKLNVGDSSVQKATFDLSSIGYQSKRLTLALTNDFTGKLAQYTFVNGNQGVSPTLFINGFTTDF